MDKTQANLFTEALVSAYPKQEVKPETTEIYIRCLIDIPFEALMAALLSHITTNKWFPTIAELRQAAFNVIPGNQAPTALEAWDEVMREVGRIGLADVPSLVGRDDAGVPIFQQQEPRFSHPAIKRAVDAITWREICLSETIGVERAHFMKMYDTYVQREAQDRQLLPEVKRLAGKLRALEEGKVVDIKALADGKRLAH